MYSSFFVNFHTRSLKVSLCTFCWIYLGTFFKKSVKHRGRFCCFALTMFCHCGHWGRYWKLIDIEDVIDNWLTLRTLLKTDWNWGRYWNFYKVFILVEHLKRPVTFGRIRPHIFIWDPIFFCWRPPYFRWRTPDSRL